jgi:hypothetical protein
MAAALTLGETLLQEVTALAVQAAGTAQAPRECFEWCARTRRFAEQRSESAFAGVSGGSGPWIDNRAAESRPATIVRRVCSAVVTTLNMQKKT